MTWLGASPGETRQRSRAPLLDWVTAELIALFGGGGSETGAATVPGEAQDGHPVVSMHGRLRCPLPPRQLPRWMSQVEGVQLPECTRFFLPVDFYSSSPHDHCSSGGSPSSSCE